MKSKASAAAYGLSLVAVRGLLSVVASCCRAHALECELSGCGACSTACNPPGFRIELSPLAGMVERSEPPGEVPSCEA